MYTATPLPKRFVSAAGVPSAKVPATFAFAGARPRSFNHARKSASARAFVPIGRWQTISSEKLSRVGRR